MATAIDAAPAAPQPVWTADNPSSNAVRSPTRGGPVLRLATMVVRMERFALRSEGDAGGLGQAPLGKESSCRGPPRRS